MPDKPEHRLHEELDIILGVQGAVLAQGLTSQRSQLQRARHYGGGPYTDLSF